MPSENPYAPPNASNEDPAQLSPEPAPAPQVSGKLAVLVILLAVMVFAWIVGRSWSLGGIVSMTAVGLLNTRAA